MQGIDVQSRVIKRLRDEKERPVLRWGVARRLDRKTSPVRGPVRDTHRLFCLGGSRSFGRSAPLDGFSEIASQSHIARQADFAGWEASLKLCAASGDKPMLDMAIDKASALKIRGKVTV